MWLTMAIGFTVGTYLFILSSYPENMQTSYFWDYFISPCCCLSRALAAADEEKTALLSSSSAGPQQAGEEAAAQAV